MSYKTFSFEIDGDGIALLTIDLPGQSMNVWNEDLISEFGEAVDKFLADDAIKGLVVTSGKKSGFLAGADLRMLQRTASMRGSATPGEMFDAQFGMNAMFRKMETGGHPAKKLQKGEAFAKPVAAAINGLALGGGLEVCLACHYRVVADDPKLTLGQPEVQVGLLPGAGGTQRIPRLIGIANALQMNTTGAPVRPQKALEQGLVHEIAPRDEVVARAKAWVKANPQVAQPWDKKGFKFPGGGGAMHPGAVQTFMGANAMAQQQTQHNFPAVEAILSCTYEGSIVPMDTAIRLESKYFTKLMLDPVAGNMIRTLFVNKQAAEKGEKRPKNVEKQELKKVGVLGAGMMGAGIAYVTANAGMEVVLIDRDQESADRGKSYSAGILQKAVDKGRKTQEQMDEFLARIHPTPDYEKLADVDLIIEAVFEDPKVKEETIKKAEAIMPADKVFATNTSTLPITGLAKHSVRPAQFIGIHFFSPVDKMPLVEIIPGDETGDLPLAVALDYVAKIKKTPIVVKDTRGFYTNRVVPPYINESMQMITEGVNPALVENAAKMLGMPVGPLALCDETSQELGLRISRATRAELGDDAVPRTKVDDLLELFVEKLGRKGRKSGGGFYDYPEGGKKHLWKGLQEHFPLADDQPTVDEVKERLLYANLVPAANCYDEGIVSDPQSADLGAIFGWGFAPWTGGPMSYIDTIGAEEFVRTAERLAQRHGPRFQPPAKLREIAAAGGKLYDQAA
ncbi:MAG: FAD-dependent oxidoreductase [Pseudomonadota bacterium]